MTTLGTCQNPECGRESVPLTRTFCHSCYVRWHRAGFPATGCPPRQHKRPAEGAPCRNPACVRVTIHLKQGYCKVCYGRWHRQGFPACGPVYRVAGWLNRALQVADTAAPPAAVKRQCENCRRFIVGDRLCRTCRRHQAAHGTPRPTPRYALHTDAPDCRCRPCAGRRAYAHRTRPPRGYTRWDAWDSTQDARLRALTGTRTVPELAAALATEFGIPRSACAVRCRCWALGLSLQVSDLGGQDVARVLGAHHVRVTQWLTTGLLVGRRLTPGLPRSPWAVTPAALEAFIRTHPECYEWRRVQGRWRHLAEGEWRRDPLYTLTEAARWLGLSQTTVRKYITLGELAAGERPDRVRWERWYVRRSALVRFQQQRQHAQEIAS